jgi:LPS export ABC transporter protein LptC
MMNSIEKDESLPTQQTGIAMFARAGKNGQGMINRDDEVEIIRFSLFRNFKIIVVLAIVFTTSFFISACKNDERIIEDWSKKKVMVDIGKNIESYLSQEGKVKAKLVSPLMLRYEADTFYTEFPKSLHVDFYDDSANIETRLDSKHGKYFENLNKVYLWDSVVVINVKGDTLKSNDLWWDQNRKLFYTDNYAEYRTKDKQIYPGKGLEATEDFTRIDFKETVGTVEVSDKNFTK